MKPFPTIPYFQDDDGHFGQPCLAFYKYDGSNLRFEWSHKTGWYKFGTRTQPFDQGHEQFGKAIPHFLEVHAGPLEQVISKHYPKVQSVIVYAEFHGPKSFSGNHDPEDKHELTIIDVNVHKKGFVDPQPFLDQFGHLNIAKLVYTGPYTPELVLAVKENTLPGVVLNEGVILKGGSGHKRWCRKIKTLAYLERLKELYGQNWKQYL
jgi:hypothetical protein